MRGEDLPMKTQKKTWIVAFALLAFIGCGNTEKEKPTNKTQAPAQAKGSGDAKTPDHDHSAGGGHAAQPEDHPHDSPHGGKVATANDKHIELKITNDGHIDVFVLDGDTKPISSKGAQGKVKLTLPDGVKEFPLTYDEKGDHLTAQSAAISAKKVVALVDLTVDGKPYSARFDYEFGAEEHHH